MSSEAAGALFPERGAGATRGGSGAEPAHSTGILPSQALRRAIEEGEILATEPIEEAQIQPASLDLRLGSYAYRVPCSFLPGKESTVGQKVESFAMHRVDLREGAVLERDCVYLVQLMESLRLPHRTSAFANPKSSTGRLDVFARLITDGGTEFDRVRPGYRGNLWAEVSPRSFSVLVRAGTRLSQLRIKRGSPQWSESALRRLHEQVGLIDAESDPELLKRGLLAISVNTEAAPGAAPHSDEDIVGYRAKRNTYLIDLDKVGHYDWRDYWEPIHARPGRNGFSRGIVLDPNDFYILASREAVTVPVDHAAEMLAYDTLVGEFRVHYAGFFDPGFGLAETGGGGTRAVLEVRTRDVPFLIEDGQVVGRLMYERLTERPDKLYGQGIGSNYQRQGLALGKHFKR